MSTFRNINDTEVAVDAPITQQLMQALKDNVLAIQEGDLSAPLQQYPTPTAGENPVATLSCQFDSLEGAARDQVFGPIRINKAGVFKVHLVINTDTGNNGVAMSVFKTTSPVNKIIGDYHSDNTLVTDAGATQDAFGTTTTDLIQVTQFSNESVTRYHSATPTLNAGDYVYVAANSRGDSGAFADNSVLLSLGVATLPMMRYTRCPYVISDSISVTANGLYRHVDSNDFMRSGRSRGYRSMKIDYWD